MRTLAKPTLALVSLAACLAACRSATGAGTLSPPPGVTLQSLAVTSRSFASRGPIPIDFTCDGADRSPQLTWSAPPQGTKSFAIVADDPDAPGGDFIHWVAFNLRADVTSLAEGADVAELGGLSGINGFNRPGYSGPCPPKMELHAYAFRVYALDAQVAARSGMTSADSEAAMNGHVLAEGTLVGTFSH